MQYLYCDITSRLLSCGLTEGTSVQLERTFPISSSYVVISHALKEIVRVSYYDQQIVERKKNKSFACDVIFVLCEHIARLPLLLDFPFRCGTDGVCIAVCQKASYLTNRRLQLLTEFSARFAPTSGSRPDCSERFIPTIDLELMGEWKFAFCHKKKGKKNKRKVSKKRRGEESDDENSGNEHSDAKGTDTEDNAESPNATGMATSGAEAAPEYEDESRGYKCELDPERCEYLEEGQWKKPTNESWFKISDKDIFSVKDFKLKVC